MASALADDDRRDGVSDRRIIEPDGRRSTDKPRKPREREKKAACPYCGYWDSLVLPSGRESKAGFYDESRQAYTRHRRCQQCQRVFYTLETVPAQA